MILLWYHHNVFMKFVRLENTNWWKINHNINEANSVLSKLDLLTVEPLWCQASSSVAEIFVA